MWSGTESYFHLYYLYLIFYYVLLLNRNTVENSNTVWVGMSEFFPVINYRNQVYQTMAQAAQTQMALMWNTIPKYIFKWLLHNRIK